MHDDEINEMLQTLKDVGVSEVQVRRTLDVLGQVEELSTELSVSLTLSEKQGVKEAVKTAILKMFK